MARILGQKLGEIWKQPVVIDNRPGAAGALGTDFAARSAPDGYTFLMGNMGPSLVNPLLTKVSYDTERDFIPVSLVATGPIVLVVNGNSPYKTLKDLVDAARAKPDTLNFGSGGSGTLAHLGGEMLNRSANIKTQHVPYKGGIAAVNDVVAGQIQMVLADVQPVLQYIKAGRLRALAISSSKRFSLLPDVPTFGELGYPDLVVLNSWGVYLPVGTPQPIVDQFRSALGQAMKNPELVKQYTDLGVDTQFSTSDELHKFNASEIDKYAKLIKEKNIRVD
jgi:tripartite-type tricarboxylate transporter receptor subunit TctC